MALAPPLITKEDADLYLPEGIFPLWHALSDADKDWHVGQASDYARATWVCTTEDFDTPSLSDDATRAVAYYCEASRAGNLYTNPSKAGGIVGAGDLIRETVKAGPVEKTVQFSGGVSTVSAADDPLKNANDIFAGLGCRLISAVGSRNLTRV